MNKVILIDASLSTTALAGHWTQLHHVVSPVRLNANASLNGNGSDHTMHPRNMHDSGDKSKNDVDSFGNLVVGN